MRKCPNCTEKVTTLEVSGVLVIGTGTLRSQKDEETITPIIPRLSLNEAGFRQYCQATCPKCGHVAPLETFVPLFTCFFFPKQESTQEIPFLGRTLHVSEEGLAMAQQLLEVDLSVNLGSFFL